ncbi:hypothetical protein NW765_003657 [Fusarium oxysporum]|nr:hypothetical protein NW765_003657 [Fusarium oxysporum]
MSIPPQLIRVKRKRDDESPVTFLQFDEGAKRHRSDSKWVYQRRHPGPQSPTIENPSPSLRDAKPVIHVSGPSDDTPPTKKSVDLDDVAPIPDTKLIETSKGTEPRRFHISRKMMMASNAAQPSGAGLNKRARYGPAVFVERSRAKASQRASQVMKTIQASIPVPQAQPSQDITMSSDASSNCGLQRSHHNRSDGSKNQQRGADRTPLFLAPIHGLLFQLPLRVLTTRIYQR